MSTQNSGLPANSGLRKKKKIKQGALLETVQSFHEKEEQNRAYRKIVQIMKL